jgi:hypothetical protein
MHACVCVYVSTCLKVYKKVILSDTLSCVIDKVVHFIISAPLSGL